MSEVDRAISESTGIAFCTCTQEGIGGGCINQASKLSGVDGREFFVKKNQLSFLTFFQAEARALQEMKDTNTIRVPTVIAHGAAQAQAYLVLEYIEEGSSGPNGQATLGSLLAQMHRVVQPHFGWSMDNCIGATPQPNPPSQNWVTFYRDHRLAHQFKLAENKGCTFNGAQALLDQINSFFTTYTPHPSLLHGDLWGGNVGYDRDRNPFLFDPASYYGDREADLAFTYMFGGFSSAFYDAYEKEYPVDPGFRIRKTLYNLYHELNHFNLFGGGYASSAQSSIDLLLQNL
ncbi:MAG: fructosamine kinase family protein [Verrucomicrobia bacterium]|nr:fructosamine kinase family protein [Verrucomicrobiota bacterium]